MTELAVELKGAEDFVSLQIPAQSWFFCTLYKLGWL